ncbi:MAG: hypothetical protein NVS3B24_02140 [Candidatus Dormibacteria bacterium]
MSNVSNNEFESYAPAQLQAACDATVQGDPAVRLGLFSHADDATLFGAWGPCKKGWSEVEPTIRWAGTRFAGGGLRYESLVAYTDGALGFTIGYERGETAIDGAEPRPMTIRVTHIWRREHESWKIVHRHGDFAPIDESPRADGETVAGSPMVEVG